MTSKSKTFTSTHLLVKSQVQPKKLNICFEVLIGLQPVERFFKILGTISMLSII